jgi:hypothetical protein
VRLDWISFSFRGFGFCIWHWRGLGGVVGARWNDGQCIYILG